MFMNKAPIIAMSVLVILSPRFSFAGLAYVSQERLVQAGASPFPTQRAVGFAPFSADVSGQSVNGSGDHMGARATQSSVLGDTFVRASGRIAADSGNDIVDYQAFLRVTFTVTAETTYHLSSGVDFDVFHPNGILDPTMLDDPLYSVSLRPVILGSVGTPLVDVRRSQYELLRVPPGSFFSVDHIGTLLPGRYELRLNVHSQFSEDAEDGTYKLNFTTGGSRPPTAVPLPPAAWAGLLTLAGLAAGKGWIARRTRRAAVGAL
jgi:hypothetical protein